MDNDLRLTQTATGAILAPESEDGMAAQEIRQARSAFLSALQARKKELADELRTIEQQIQALNLSTPVRARGTRHGTSIKEMVATLLKERAQPMHAGDIVNALREQGVSLSEKDPRAVVVTAARRLVKDQRANQTGPNTFAAP